MGCLAQLISLALGLGLAYVAHVMNAPDIVVFLILAFFGIFAIGFGPDGIDFDIFD